MQVWNGYIFGQFQIQTSRFDNQPAWLDIQNVNLILTFVLYEEFWKVIMVRCMLNYQHHSVIKIFDNMTKTAVKIQNVIIIIMQ